MPALIDITGQTFGRLTAVEYVGDSKWRFSCVCGNTSIAHGYQVTRGHTRSCGCYHSEMMSQRTPVPMAREQNPSWKGYEDIPYGWFSRYFERAGQRRQRSGSITIEDVWALYLRQNGRCALSGLPIGWYDDGDSHSASIDRIDSTREYDLDNVQLVHKDVNLMKNAFPQGRFIEICRAVSAYAAGD